jgi:hypothetical protein
LTTNGPAQERPGYNAALERPGYKNTMNRQQLHQLIDLCRPGSDDLHDPDLADLAQAVHGDDAARTRYESVQKLDAAIQSAFHDVPVPADLEQRLLASGGASVLNTAAAGRTEPGDDASGPVDVVKSGAALPVPARASRTGPSRRHVFRWAAIGGSVAAAVLVAGAVWAIVGLWPQPPQSLDALVQTALKWTDESRLHSWEQDLSQAPLQAYPLEAALRAQPLRWQRLVVEGETIVAYDLSPPGQPMAAQFTLRTTRTHSVPSAMPSTPLSNTGGFCVGACQRNGVLYVLVIEGDASRYRQFVRAQLPVT